MLGCWASSGDIRSAGSCAEAAKMLHECMRTSVSELFWVEMRILLFYLQAGKRKDPKPTINYHLARLAKRG